MIKMYVNLTGGLEWLPHIHVDGYVRIQSTWLEQKRWWPIMADLDYAFLIDVALGHGVVLYDTSAHKHESRAIYQGIPWITYVLNKVWLNRHYTPIVRGCNVSGYFAECFRLNSPEKVTAIRRLTYVAKITGPESVFIKGECMPAMHDGDYEWHKEVIRCLKEERSIG